MPIREFKCTKGHTFEQLVKMDGSDEPKQCQHVIADDECKAPVERIMSVNAKSFPGADSWRR